MWRAAVRWEGEFKQDWPPAPGGEEAATHRAFGTGKEAILVSLYCGAWGELGVDE